MISFTVGGYMRGKPIEAYDENGNRNIYPSITAASIALGVSISAIRVHIRNGEKMGWIGENGIFVRFSDEA